MRAGARAAVAALPGAPGVYRFRDARGRVLYIGRAVDLRRRVGSYWTDLGDRRHLTRMVPQIAQVEAVVCDSAHEAAWLERNLLERSKPRWNRIRGGLEVPVHIRLEQRDGSVRLQVVHPPLDGTCGRPGSTIRVFGPYLGGARARLAVSALDRVLPLGYAADRLSGCQRDLARARGVGVPDREALLTTVTAVLQRRPGAVAEVRERLAQIRDRASESLAFELAARVQQEIGAVDWIVADQKVTLPAPASGSPAVGGPAVGSPAVGGPAAGAAPADCDVCGWADGLLLRLGVRGGRLCTWELRACSRSAAQRYLDGTPARWWGFASRNAELAKRLADGHAAAR